MKYEYHLVEAWIYLICALGYAINTPVLFWFIKCGEDHLSYDTSEKWTNRLAAVNWALCAVVIFTGVYYREFAR